MAIYDLDIPDSYSHGGKSRGWLSGKLHGAMRAVQYSRMLQALSELSDAQLEQAGLTRSDIPARAHYCIYGENA